MESQDAQSILLLKIWPWLEVNLKRLAIAAVIFALLIFGFYFVSYQRQQNEIAAGQALTQAMMNPNASQAADAVSSVASQYPNTLAGGRAALQSAALSFTAGKFADAQTQFQKYLDAHSDGSFAAVAALGVAASLDAQGKANLAITAYQKVISFSSAGSEAGSAKFALGRISEAQGKLSEAEKYFEDVARSNPNSSLGSEAGLRAMELKSKLPATIKS